jgi:hypothetical protein
MRHYGVTVQDNPFDKRGMYLEEEEESEKIPLQLEGTTIYLTTRTLTERELHECRHITLSSKAAWNPNEVQFSEYGHQRMEDKLTPSRNSRIDVCECGLYPDTIVERLIAEVRVNVTDDVPTRRTFVSNERHLGVSAEELSDRWCIGLSQAQHTIKVTTQLATRSATMPLSRGYRADRVFETPLLRGQFYCATMDGRCKSLDGNRYSQVFASKDFFAVVYPMETKSMAGDALRQFIHDYGRPERLTFDSSREQCGKKTEFMKSVRKYSIKYHVTEPKQPNHNFAEGVIREVRKKWYRIMVRKKVPQRLWDYGLRWVCEIQNCTSNSARGLEGKCLLEKVTQESVDISEYLDFGFYDWVWYKENAGLGETKLGRWLGVLHKVSTLMSFWILTRESKVLSRTIVQRATNLELQTDENKERITAYNKSISEGLGQEDFFVEDDEGKVTPGQWGDSLQYDPEFQDEFGNAVSDLMLPDADAGFTPDTFDDTYLNMELSLPRNGGEVEFA